MIIRIKNAQPSVRRGETGRKSVLLQTGELRLSPDAQEVHYLIPAVAAETATGTGFYYAKAKVENRIKLMKLYNVEPTEQSFNEQGGYYNG